MFPSQKIVNLIESLKKGNQDVSDALLQELIKITEVRGSYNVSEKLRRVYSLPYKASLTGAISPSSSHHTNENSSLYELRKSKVSRSEIVLSTENEQLLEDLIYSYKHKNKLKKMNIPIDSRVLLHGPPGTGKTMFAYVLAHELNMPLMHINIDRVISSYLGETGKNISSIFEKAQAGSYLVLLDEFDSIAKRRDDDLELGELKRVVTVLLQNLDSLDPDTVIVAATNHEHLLDRAIKRRFAYEINLTYLDDKSRLKLFKLALEKSGVFDEVELDSIAAISAGVSGAQITQTVNRALRKWVLTDKKDNMSVLLLDEVIKTVYSIVFFDSKNKNDITQLKNIYEVARYFDEDRYTYSYLESLTKIPHSSIHYIISKEI